MEKIQKLKEFVEILKKEISISETIILTAHRDPDGDAIGSVLAMQEALQNIGKDVDIVLDEMPKVFLELKNSDKILKKLKYDITYDMMKAIIIGVITDTGRI